MSEELIKIETKIEGLSELQNNLELAQKQLNDLKATLAAISNSHIEVVLNMD